jgi:hypothetical protein
MIVRRNFLIGVAASLVCAPAVIRASSLMPVRSFAPLVERAHYGFVERLYVHSHISKIMDLRASGLSLPAIADALNLRGSRAMNGIPWDVSGHWS